MRTKILFYCPSQENLAEDLFAFSHFRLKRGLIAWGKFDDGFPCLQVLDSSKLADTDVIFLADFHNAEEIFRQLAVIYALQSYGINSLKVFLPFFPTGTMDRICEDGQIVTAKTLARMLSATPAAACPMQVNIFDIHAPQEQFYFSDQVRVRCLSAVDHFLDVSFKEGWTDETTVFAFPDEGAYKRFGKYFSKYQKIVCEKRREADGSRLITVKEGEPKGKDIIIIDDLIMSGSTILECAKILKAQGALSVGAYATHGVFPDNSWQHFFDAGVKLYLTDSNPLIINQVRDNFKQPGAKIISLYPIILREIFRNCKIDN